MSFSQPILDPLPIADLTGRVALVTGANTGLGLAASKHLASMNPAKVIMAVRSLERGEKALEDLKAETGFIRAEVRLVDFASFASVKTFTQTVIKENERLDLLLENAAVSVEEYNLTEDGWETTTIVASLFAAAVNAEDGNSLSREVIGAESPLKFMNGKEYSTRIFPQQHVLAEFPTMLARRYVDVKMFNFFFARELQKILKNVTVNSVNPGMCASELLRNMTGERAKAFHEMYQAVAYTSEEGARCLVHGLVAEQGNEKAVRGEYLSLMKKGETSPFSNSEEGQTVQRNIWRESVEILTKVDPSVGEIIRDLETQ